MTGLIGIGRMGTAMAERFLASGFAVLGYDLNVARREALGKMGGATTPSAAELARDARLVVLSLPDSRVVRRVLDEIEPHLRPGAMVVDATSGGPEEMAGFGERLARREVHYLDACICGSSRHVRERDAIVICGGEESAYIACAPLLAAFARHSFHAGPAGSGARVKLVVNLVEGLHRAALAEGLSLATACGLEQRIALEVLRAGPVCAPDLKDVRTILDAARHWGVDLPLTERHRELLEQGQAVVMKTLD